MIIPLEMENLLFFELEEGHRQCFILVKDGNGKK